MDGGSMGVHHLLKDAAFKIADIVHTEMSMMTTDSVINKIFVFVFLFFVFFFLFSFLFVFLFHHSLTKGFFPVLSRVSYPLHHLPCVVVHKYLSLYKGTTTHV